jgi:hypothetical protein
LKYAIHPFLLFEAAFVLGNSKLGQDQEQEKGRFKQLHGRKIRMKNLKLKIPNLGQRGW